MIPLELLGFLHLGIVDVLDIVVVAIVIYVVFRWLKGSSAMNILIAILALLAIRFVATAMNMKLLSSLLDAVINVGAIALIVIFQPEIRQFLSRLGRRGGWVDRLLGRKRDDLGAQAAKEIAQACRDMAENRTGALIVILHKNSLQDVIDSGDRIDAQVSSRLLENIFFKDSPLHDGAVIIGGGRILAARCTLPITEQKIPAKYGMRHKSAVGISERSDADVIVISEQRGTISFVRDGEISPVAGMNELKLMLEPRKEQEKQ